MKRGKKKKITTENVERAGLWKISGGDFDTTFAKVLGKDLKHLESHRKKVMKEYNKTKNLKAFLVSLKVIAMTERTQHL